uniref:Fibrous sheath-interacting protein 2 C-terminal domain-containing protein n=1 Tax=Callorhinchus milii TaxID=7868 RepID=A0A4W3H0R9_CALMI
MSLSHTGHNLQEVRDALLTGSSDIHNVRVESHAHLHQERLPDVSHHGSLDISGRIDVKPREVIARNSFINLLNPDISKVELLKDVKNKKDLIMRLVAHDVLPIKDDEMEDDNREEELELKKQHQMVDKILREDVGLFDVSPETSDTDDRQESTDSGLTVNLDTMHDIQDVELMRRESIADKTYNDYVVEKQRYSNAHVKRNSLEPFNSRSAMSDATGNPRQMRNSDFKSSLSKFSRFSAEMNPQDPNREFYAFRDNYVPHPPLGRKSWNKSTSRVRFDTQTIPQTPSP